MVKIYKHNIQCRKFLPMMKYYLLAVTYVYLFGVLRRFQHCTGHITMGSWKGRGNQYIQFVRVLYCKLPTNGKQLPAFPLEAMPGIEPRPHRWEARVLPLCHRGPRYLCYMYICINMYIWLLLYKSFVNSSSPQKQYVVKNTVKQLLVIT